MRGLLAWTLALIAAGAFSPPAEPGWDSVVQRALWGVLPTPSVQAKKLAVPKATFNYFENLPVNLHYFNGSKTVLHLDDIYGLVYISEDEGKSWSVVDDIPNRKASHFVAHPFDDRMAFVLTRGTTHYVTEDHGRTWRSFDVPSEPGAAGMSPLTFHADAEKSGYILYQGYFCDDHFGPNCYYQTLYTKDAFATEPKVLLSHTSSCTFAHASREFSSDVHTDLIYCTSYEPNVDGPHPGSSRLIASSDFFVDDRHMVDYGGGPKEDVTAIQVMSKFMTIAVRTMDHGWTHDFTLYVTSDCKNWYKAQFPHNSDGINYSYTALGKGDRSLVVDVQSLQSRRIGTLFLSNSSGTDFVETLRHTHRSNQGWVDFLNIAGVQGGGVINYVKNARDFDNGGRGTPVELKSLISYDDGSSWNALKAPERDMHNKTYECHGDTNDTDTCSLHLHLLTQGVSTVAIIPPTPPGFIMAAGSVSKTLLNYDLSDMYLSRDAGATWKQVRHGAHKYAFGDQGNIIILVDDEKSTDHVRYSIDSGETWQRLDLGMNLRAMSLTTAPTITSHSLLLMGGLARGDQKGKNRIVVIHLDFSYMQTRQCDDDDVEKWYAQGVNGTDCIMGYKQWFWRKKAESNCYMGDQYTYPEPDAEVCLCTDADYGCDYNYVLEGKECVPIGPEPIPAGACFGHDPDETYQGESGYRLLAGNTCAQEGGVRKDEPITKNCTETLPDEGEVAHQTFTFNSALINRHYFAHGKSILVHLWDRTVWQSSDEGYTWREVIPGQRFLSIWIHPYAEERAYLLADTESNYATTDGGQSWNSVSPPLQQQLSYGSGRLSFHPTQPDYLIWTGYVNCHAYDEGERNCHAEAYLSLDHGRNWRLIETYVGECLFAETFTSKTDDDGILCSSHQNKTGHQHAYNPGNLVELVIGHNWYEDKNTLFDHIVGFGAFGEYLIVAALALDTYTLDLQISLVGNEFVPAKLPQGIQLRKKDFTKVLQATPDAIFLQEGISGEWGIEWGTLLKSNANGTYYGVSLEHVNGNGDHEIAYHSMPGVDGVARVNILTNPDEAVYTGKKKLQTRITHNDGGSWQAIKPPSRDSDGTLYPCDDETKCALHLHGPKQGFFLRNVQPESSATGLMVAVGNVGEFLAPRSESDMFLTRNAGITWEEVHKDTHIWAFGDSGSILVIANQEQSTDHVQYTTDHGLHWKEYNFGIELWVDSITSDSGGGSRKFLLAGWDPQASRGRLHATTVVYLNFAELTSRQCVLDVMDSARSDFELWKPSEDFGQCLLGSKAHYRKKRSANCYIGKLDVPPAAVDEHCECTAADFECEFNHVRDSTGECVLKPGAVSLASENTCVGDDEFWYERTAYRKISKSLCTMGTRLDQGTAHHCHGHWFKSFVSRFWWTFVVLPVGIIALVAVWWYRRRGPKRGAIRLPDGDEAPESPSPLRARLASIPFHVAEGIAKFWNYLKSFPGISMSLFGSRRRTQEVALEEDA